MPSPLFVDVYFVPAQTGILFRGNNAKAWENTKPTGSQETVRCFDTNGMTRMLPIHESSHKGPDVFRRNATNDLDIPPVFFMRSGLTFSSTTRKQTK